ncbi:HAD family hydrolase [Roseibium sp. H3510]|uniref:HAD family hydrolase n=1 Tax=Roseibium algae TaxID=3123038 RepID=A0ABU8TTF2_9HYPH
MIAPRPSATPRLLPSTCGLLLAISFGLFLSASSGTDYNLPASPSLCLIALSWATGSLLLTWQILREPLQHLNKISLAVSFICASSAGGLYLIGAEFDALITPLFAATCIVSGCALANVAQYQFDRATQSSNELPIKQIIAACLIGLCAAIAWASVDEPEIALARATTALALSWPYSSRLQDAILSRTTLKQARHLGAELNGSEALAAIHTCTAIAFDRPALLQNDKLVVTDVHAFDNRSEPLLAVAAAAQSSARHPIGAAIRALATDWALPQGRPDEWEEVPGLGVVAMIGGKSVAVGNPGLMAELQVDCFTANSLCRPLQASGKTCVIVAIGNRAVGILALQPTLHLHAADTLAWLHGNGVETVLVTGTSLPVAQSLFASSPLKQIKPDIRQHKRLSAAESHLAGAAGLFIGASESGRRGLFTLSAQANETAILIASLPRGELLPLPGLVSLSNRMKKKTRLSQMFALGVAILAGLLGAMGLLPVTVLLFVFAITIAGYWFIAEKLT